jgi:hypothetical protein
MNLDWLDNKMIKILFFVSIFLAVLITVLLIAYFQMIRVPKYATVCIQENTIGDLQYELNREIKDKVDMGYTPVALGISNYTVCVIFRG